MKNKSMHQQISEILVKWGMPTRHVAINELESLFRGRVKALVPSSLSIKNPTRYGVGFVDGINTCRITILEKLKKI